MRACVCVYVCVCMYVCVCVCVCHAPVKTLQCAAMSTTSMRMGYKRLPSTPSSAYAAVLMVSTGKVTPLPTDRNGSLPTRLRVCAKRSRQQVWQWLVSLPARPHRLRAGWGLWLCVVLLCVHLLGLLLLAVTSTQDWYLLISGSSSSAVWSVPASKTKPVRRVLQVAPT